MASGGFEAFDCIRLPTVAADGFFCLLARRDCGGEDPSHGLPPKPIGQVRFGVVSSPAKSCQLLRIPPDLIASDVF